MLADRQTDTLVTIFRSTTSGGVNRGRCPGANVWPLSWSYQHARLQVGAVAERANSIIHRLAAWS